MKKLYILSAILVFMSGAFMQAMEPVHNTRPREFRMIDIAFAHDDWQTIFNLLDEMPSLVDTYESSRGYTLLYLAVGIDDLLLVQTLLDKYGANPNRGGFSAAIFAEDIPMIKLLLEYGANPDLPLKGGITARKYALMNVKRHPKLLETVEAFDRK
jgi:hypothetical protein